MVPPGPAPAYFSWFDFRTYIWLKLKGIDAKKIVTDYYEKQTRLFDTRKASQPSLTLSLKTSFCSPHMNESNKL
jgi:hypothetical protein